MANFFILVIEVWFLSGLVLYLHHLSGRIGFAPLIFTLGGITALLQAQLGVVVELIPGIEIFVSAVLPVTVILMGILVLYISNGAVPARLTLYSCVGIALLIVVMLHLYRYQLSLPNGYNLFGLPDDVAVIAPDPRVTFASMVAFLADIFVMIVVYQGIKNAIPAVPEWLVIGLALLLSLWTDAIVFGFAADFGEADLFRFLPGDILGKSVIGLLVWPPAAIYLTQIAPHAPGYIGPQNRRTFDLLFGSLESVKLDLVIATAELEKSEESRRQQAAYFQEVFDHVSEGLWLAAPGQYQLYVSPAYARIFGRSAAGLYANPKSFMDAIHADDKERVIAAIHRQSEGDYDETYRIVRPGGEVRWVRDRAFPVLNEKGEVYRIAGILADITERKQAEQEHHELELERERVDMLREFIGEASHDLKSPLTAINIKVYMLRQSDDAERRTGMLDEIEQVTGRMNKMIDDLLTLARLEHLNERQCVDFDAAELVRDVYTQVQPRAEQKQQTLMLSLPPDPLPVRMIATPNDLMRAISNLVENAVNYTPAGGTITLSLRAQDSDLVISVADTGIGIASEDFPRLFDRFFRASNGRKQTSDGTGLGLPIVKRIVEQHGGRVDLQSELGKGSTFTIYLPFDTPTAT